MRFICSDCVSEEYSIIPAFIIKKWNFKKFQISKAAKETIEKWYDKPVIHIKQKDPLIRLSHPVNECLILKRKIHKIFDLMKCEDYDKFVIQTLGDYKHFVLKESLFSLRDLVDIYENRMQDKLIEFLHKFETHLLNECASCDYKGGNCMMCLSDEIIYAYDIEKIFFCNECKKLFHKKCCSFHPCIINR